MRNALVVLAAVTLLQGLAFAFPGPDSIGIYASETDAVTTTSTTGPFEAVTLYLLITNPTFEGVSGWQCMIEYELISGTNNMTGVSWALTAGAAGATNVYDDPYFEVGLGAGTAALREVAGVVKIATMTGYVMAPTDRIALSINGLPGSNSQPQDAEGNPTHNLGNPVYVHPDNPGVVQALQPNTGGAWESLPQADQSQNHDTWAGNVCFIINPDAEVIVENEESTWSTVKTLFR